MSGDNINEPEVFAVPCKRRRYNGSFAYNTKFNPKWMEKYPCIVGDPSSELYFRCNICDRSISCKHQGITDVRRHVKTYAHMKRKMSSQAENPQNKPAIVESESALSPEDNPSSIPKLCRHFYEMGCMTASGGALSMKYGDNIVITPSGLQKEKVTEDDLFMLNQDGKVLVSPSKNLKPSSCLPNFMHLYEIRDAQVAFHLHSKNAVLASILHKGTHLKISNLHVIKAIKNGVTGEHYKFTDTVSVPIIENRDDENDIQANLSEALRTNPECHAVIIRGHGYYVWGKNYKETKIMCEAFEYLFDMANKMKLYGVENVL